MLSLPPALAALGRWHQFVCWFAVPSKTTPGKLDKLPVTWADFGDKKAGDVVSAHDATYWTDAETAALHAPRFDRGHGCGVGFVLTKADPFFFLDIDGALHDGQWSPLASDLCKTFAGAGVEVSVSGTGLHILGCYSGELVHSKKNIPLHLELYTSDRFIALTGAHAMGDVWTDHTVALQSVVAGLFQPKVSDFEGWTSEPVAEWAGPEDDDHLIARAMRSQPRSSADAAFSGGPAVPSFAQLWNADADALGAYWPHASQAYDASSADMALANNLSFFTGKNCERTERLMRRSALVRDKWDVRPDYLADTIINACGFLRSVLNEPPTPIRELPEHLSAGAVMSLRTQAEYMAPETQADYFRGCVYIGGGMNVAYDSATGRLLNRSAFDVLKGGYLFVMDPMGKKTSESAWTAFTQSRVLQCPTADDVCFRPEVETGGLVVVGNHVLVNTYFPHEADSEPGDVAPFLDFMARILPDAGDREILLHYMASLVQNPGVKFQWWPVIQGAEGNGKTLILSALTYAVGEHYTHLPNAQAMAREGLKFNSWIHRKLFIGVEEIYTSERRSFLEEFKTVVTNERTGMEPKGMEQVTRDNRANGILVTNHMDGVPITADTRRYAILYTKQQKAEDIVRDGMGGEYFPELYNWFKSGGNRRLAHFLKTMTLRAELDPAQLCVRAPKTSSYVAALHASRGRAELEVLEAIDQGRPGFCGGFVSSRWLDDLLDRIRANVPRTKRDALLESLGFVPHPGLPNGRTARAVAPDGCKTRLFVRDGHVSLNTTDPETLASAYERAQTTVAAEVAFGASPGARA